MNRTFSYFLKMDHISSTFQPKFTVLFYTTFNQIWIPYATLRLLLICISVLTNHRHNEQLWWPKIHPKEMHHKHKGLEASLRRQPKNEIEKQSFKIYFESSHRALSMKLVLVLNYRVWSSGKDKMYMIYGTDHFCRRKNRSKCTLN